MTQDVRSPSELMKNRKIKKNVKAREFIKTSQTGKNSFSQDNWNNYDYDTRIRQDFERMEKCLSRQNIEAIKKYDKSMIMIPLAKATRSKHLQTLKLVSKRIEPKLWKDVLRDDIDNITVWIMETYGDHKGRETNTTYDMKKVLKLFYRWFKTGDRRKQLNQPEPYEIQNVRCQEVENGIVREDLITEDDVKQILTGCLTARDRALVYTHFEAGTRPGEILSLRIKDVKFDQYGAQIHVDGKTGQRPIRLVKSVPMLLNWINNHPFTDDKDSPLFVVMSSNRRGQPLSYSATAKIVKESAKRAGVEKKITLNLFRHSEATRSANFLTEALMKKRHGWSPTSRMPAKYTHLNNSDVDEAILKHEGIAKVEEAKKPIPIKCHFCETFNEPDSELCTNCIKPLNLEVAEKITNSKNNEVVELKSDVKELRRMLLEEILPALKGLRLKTD